MLFYHNLGAKLGSLSQLQITVIKRKEGSRCGSVQGSFQAVDELSSQVQNALSSGAQTVAWDLALSSNFCATLHHTANSAFVTSQDSSVSPAKVITLT